MAVNVVGVGPSVDNGIVDPMGPSVGVTGKNDAVGPAVGCSVAVTGPSVGLTGKNDAVGPAVGCSVAVWKGPTLDVPLGDPGKIVGIVVVAPDSAFGGPA